MSRPLVGPRLQRVLALVPWILAHPGVTLAELATRFEVSERELERDLELLPMCGLPPLSVSVCVTDAAALGRHKHLSRNERTGRSSRIAGREWIGSPEICQGNNPGIIFSADDGAACS